MMDATEHADLVVRKEDPFNAETPLSKQTGPITPVEEFYVRNHFAIPHDWEQLTIEGTVANPLLLSLDDVKSFGVRTVTATVECAGNGRAFLDPPTPGVQWQLGAVGTAEWTGTPLKNILVEAQLAPESVEVLFVGADHGVPDRLDQHIVYERSLPVSHALSDDVLLCWAMNGAPLTPSHGAPLRLLVPGWYGMASVKWLARISGLTQPFDGYYQTTDYVIQRETGDEPCRNMMVRAVITTPHDRGVLTVGQTQVKGYCWSGHGAVSGVDVSTDGGTSWRAADLGEGLGAYAWRPWVYEWANQPLGKATLLARAHGESGEVQPVVPVWTPSGYANNAGLPVSVTFVA